VSSPTQDRAPRTSHEGNGTASPARSADAACQPFTILPEAVYTVPAATAAIQANPSTLPREIRAGRLRAAKRAGRLLILGQWLLWWVQAGEVRRHRKPTVRPAPHTDPAT
jgi:hypothetical protein